MVKNTDKVSKKGKAPEVDQSKKRKREKKEAGDKKAAPSALFGGVKDAELDDIFSKSTVYATPAAPVASSSKLPATKADVPEVKRARTSPSPEADGNVSDVESGFDSDNEAAEILRLAGIAEEEGDNADDVEEGEDEEEGEDQEEDADEDDESESESDSEAELVHESAKKPVKKDKGKKAPKFTPAGESQADRDRRTVFVGNLPLEAAKSKGMLHQLKAHLISFVPTAKIESTRFRSVPFATATAALPTDDPEKDENRRLKREKERASAWRAKQDGDTKGDEEADQAKVFIDSKGKRKVAFIKKDFHSELGSCNAYVVFAHPHPDRAANVAPIQDPYEAATAVLAANGSTVLDRTIRVDSVRLPSSVGLATATNALSKRDAWLPSGTDPKKSLFVGGLDYASKEEDVRVFFEELVKAERGPAKNKWVIGVRIVRDKETQLGKGFGYVHFTDRESVDEILAMDATKIRFAKRALRVQPCKTLPSTSTLNNQLKAAAQPRGKGDKGKSATAGKSARAGPVPKGNPKLGEKIKDLSKEDRKVAKSADADRQARRLAKKKARGKMDKDEKGAVRLNLTKSEKERTKGAKPKAKMGKKRAPSAIAKMKGSRA